MPASRPLRLCAIGTLAGLFSGLFGVGGGTVLVPLVILWLGYEEHEATGTSLLAIALIALAGVLGQGLYGNVHVRDGVLMAAPAMLGVALGTQLQQRVAARSVSLLFAGLLCGVAVELALQ